MFVTGALEPRFLLYSNAKLGEIKGISLNENNAAEVITPITNLSHPVALDFDTASRYIYYSDATQFRIGRRKLDGTGRNDSFITKGQQEIQMLLVLVVLVVVLVLLMVVLVVVMLVLLMVVLIFQLLNSFLIYSFNFRNSSLPVILTNLDFQV